MLLGLLLQTAAEELINGLEEYIVESFVRLILHTPSYFINQCTHHSSPQHTNHGWFELVMDA